VNYKEGYTDRFEPEHFTNLAKAAKRFLGVADNVPSPRKPS
jgi:hypothetical protein